MTKFIKIHGIQRTGTNYMTQLLRMNFNAWVSENACGSKHSQILLLKDGFNLDKSDRKPQRIKKVKAIIERGEAYFVVTFKHPISWVISYAKWKGRPINNGNIRNWMKRYNSRNIGYLNDYAKHSHIMELVKYEELIESYIIVLNRIMNKFNLERLHKQYKDQERIVKPRGRIDKVKFDKGFYLNKRYLRIMPPYQQETILRLTDKRIIHQFNYK